MSKKEKLLEKVRNNPRNVRFDNIDSILLEYGFVRRQSRKGTSHYVYKLGEQKIVVVWRRPFVHVDAVKDVLNAIKILHSE
jgi:hypothetical protein